MTNKIQRLEEFLKTLQNERSAEFNGTIVLGEVVGQIVTGWYLDPTHAFYGRTTVKKTERGYEFVSSDSDSANILTTKTLRLQRESAPYYITKLRRHLTGIPHLILDSEDNPRQDEKYHFAILYSHEP